MPAGWEETDHSSGGAWKSKWPSWAFRPNEPCDFCGRKATLTMLRHWPQFVPNMSTRHPRTLSSTSSSSQETDDHILARQVKHVVTIESVVKPIRFHVGFVTQSAVSQTDRSAGRWWLSSSSAAWLKFSVTDLLNWPRQVSDYSTEINQCPVEGARSLSLSR